MSGLRLDSRSKRTFRSVDSLHLWEGNPRFDIAENLSRMTIADFTEEVIATPPEKKDFVELIKSIVNNGFMDFDPILVWKDNHDKYVVAEGNRRVLALKLLRHPNKVPESFRKFMVQQSRLIGG